MISIDHLPACKKYLEINWTKFNEPHMNHFWASVIVADFCDDEALEAFGGFNFDDSSDENGKRQLARLEQCIRQRRHRSLKFKAPDDLVALLGSRGVKTSQLTKAEDWWKAAEILFEFHVNRVQDPYSIAFQIRKIPKKQRKALADQNFRNLPPEWISDAENHARKLQ